MTDITWLRPATTRNVPPIKIYPRRYSGHEFVAFTIQPEVVDKLHITPDAPRISVGVSDGEFILAADPKGYKAQFFKNGGIHFAISRKKMPEIEYGERETVDYVQIGRMTGARIK